jgi:tyrosine-protein kinase Etk/Wzc
MTMDATLNDTKEAAADSQSLAHSLLAMLDVITKYRKFISRFVLAVTVSAVILALLLPKWYKSTAAVFPAEKAELFAGMEGVASLARSFSASRALTALGSNPEADRYIAILKSHTVLMAVIEKFDLVNVYDITKYPIEKTKKELLENVDFSIESEGNLTVTVLDKEPQRAADMANFFVAMLNKTNTELQVQNARGNRMFIEERYKKNLVDLAAAEDSLKAFQQKFGVIAMPEQTQASIKAAAELAGQLALREVQAGVLRHTYAADNPTLAAAEIEISELRKKLNQMSTGSVLPGREMSVFVPFKSVPALGSEYVRRFREMEIQYKVLQFITPLFEQAKVEEKRSTPSVVVLDTAFPAERKWKPKISLYALVAFVSSLLVALFGVFCAEGIAKLRASNPVRFDSALSLIQSDWFGLRRFWKKG